MAHCINGFIAQFDALAQVARSIPGAVVCRLNLGFGFLPHTDRAASHHDPVATHELLNKLTRRMAEWAAEQSRHFALIYIETEYFGGPGTQCAMEWRDGAVQFGPVKTGEGCGPSAGLSEEAINRALRRLGVMKGKSLDEFGALGLGRYRDNDDWAHFAG